MHQVVANTQGVGMLGLQVEPATAMDEWGFYFLVRCEETDDSNRNCEIKEALSRPKHGEMQPGVSVALRREKMFLNRCTRRRKICSRDTKIDIEWLKILNKALFASKYQVSTERILHGPANAKGSGKLM